MMGVQVSDMTVSSGVTGVTDSVRSQVFTVWEMIIVDDGSSDTTLEVASRQTATDSRIKILHHSDGENRGVSASRNLAIDASRGSFLT